MNEDDYKNIVVALKEEIGYQDTRERVLKAAIQQHASDVFVMPTNFEYDGKKYDTKWVPNVIKMLKTYRAVIGTITDRPHGDSGEEEGHYVGVLFTGNTAFIFDPAVGTKEADSVYSAEQTITFLKPYLAKFGITLQSVSPFYSCQMSFIDEKATAIHVDTFCQTWSLILLIDFIRTGNINAFKFRREGIKEGIQKRHNVFIQKLRENILPYMDRNSLNATAKKYIGKKVDAYSILMNDPRTYLFFRDTPYS